MPIVLAYLVLSVVLPSTSAHAGYVVNAASAESINFALYNTNAGAFGSPIFSSNPSFPNMLLSAGPLAAGSPPGTFPTNPYPGLQAVNTQGNTYTLPAATGAFSNSISSDPSLLNSLTYGSATVKGAVSTNLANKGSGVNNVIGTSFNAGTFLNSGTGMAAATAAVMYSSIHGDFSYTGTTASVHAGSVLSASGFVTPGGFVELANVGTITVGTTSFSFSMIAAGAFDHAGNFMQYSSGPLSFNYLGDGSFTVSGTYTAPSAISVPTGTRIVIDSYLTMIADPGSSVMLTPDQVDVSDLPDIVAGVGGPQGVPEPTTAIQLGLGMLLASGAAVWRRRTRSRSSRRLKLPEGFRQSMPGMIALGFVLFGSSHASAASITINDLDSIPSLQSGAFYTFSSHVYVTDQVTFDGKYHSAGGFPSPGSSVTYTVVFTEKQGSTTVDSDLTRITVSALSTPDTHKNVEISVLFEGIVSTPVSPGAGIYFVSEPSGYFDVAAYLVSQGAPHVPSDLSVRVMSLPPVPEPASLLSVSVGLVGAGFWGARRRRIRKS